MWQYRSSHDVTQSAFAMESKSTPRHAPRTHRLRNGIVATLGWFIPPALAYGLYRGDSDALAWMTTRDTFVAHPGFYAFWCGVVYVQMLALLVRTARHGTRIPQMLIVLVVGGLVNLLKPLAPAESRTQAEPWGAQLLLAPLVSFTDTIAAPRLVCMWAAVNELPLHKAVRIMLAVHPVLLALVAGWASAPVLFTSLYMWRELEVSARCAQLEGTKVETKSPATSVLETARGMFRVGTDEEEDSEEDEQAFSARGTMPDLPSMSEHPSLHETRAAYETQTAE